MVLNWERNVARRIVGWRINIDGLWIWQRKRLRGPEALRSGNSTMLGSRGVPYRIIRGDVRKKRSRGRARRWRW
jgi:hypothetical protein